MIVCPLQTEQTGNCKLTVKFLEIEKLAYKTISSIKLGQKKLLSFPSPVIAFGDSDMFVLSLQRDNVIQVFRGKYGFWKNLNKLCIKRGDIIYIFVCVVKNDLLVGIRTEGNDSFFVTESSIFFFCFI